MIAHLRGTVLEKNPQHAILDVAGVGYDVQIPASTYSSLPDTGAVAALRIHTHVREDALVLFGFATADEKTVFERLITVSGIGPKLAVTILSGLATEELVMAIRTSDVLKLVRIPGVGKKTAERIVLELKDKLQAIGVPETTAAAQKTAPALDPLAEDVLSALMNLGSNRAAAEEAIRKARSNGTEEKFDAFFRAALALVR